VKKVFGGVQPDLIEAAKAEKAPAVRSGRSCIHAVLLV
jgi:hypothetical protein